MKDPSRTSTAKVAPRVLVVEDEEPVCTLLDELLTEEGYRVTCAGSDQAAYDVLKRERRDIAALVVDINLGRGTTGFDVARFARGLTPALSVIYITGGSPDSITRFGVEGGTLVQALRSRAAARRAQGEAHKLSSPGGVAGTSPLRRVAGDRSRAHA